MSNSALFAGRNPDWTITADGDASVDGYVLSYNNTAKEAEWLAAIQLPVANEQTGNSVTFAEDGGSGAFAASTFDVLTIDSDGTKKLCQVDFTNAPGATTVLTGGGTTLTSTAVAAAFRPAQDTVVGMAIVTDTGGAKPCVVTAAANGFIVLSLVSGTFAAGAAGIGPFSYSAAVV